MYIQITKACNMSCDHCSFSCEVGKWTHEHMDWNTYCYCLEMAAKFGDTVCLGGGEPTIHPEFWRFLREAVKEEYLEGVWLATNGKKTKTAILLAQLAGNAEEAFYDLWTTEWDEEGEEVLSEELDERVDGTSYEDWDKRFSCAVSRDYFHEPIDTRVFEAFTRCGQEIRDNSHRLSNLGAAKENNLGGEDTCACSELSVAPDGTVRMCGCPGSLVLGKIWDADMEDILDRCYETRFEWKGEDGHNQCGNPDFGFPEELGKYILHGIEEENDSLEEAA